MAAHLIAGPPHAIAAAVPVLAEAMATITAPLIAAEFDADGRFVAVHDVESIAAAYALAKLKGATIRVV